MLVETVEGELLIEVGGDSGRDGDGMTGEGLWEGDENPVGDDSGIILWGV